MTTLEKEALNSSCSLVVIDTHAQEVLLDCRANRPRIPRTSLPAGERVAQFLTDILYRHFGICTVLLALLPCRTSGPFCAVHRFLAPRREFAHDCSFAPLAVLDDEQLPRALLISMGEVLRGEAASLGRFAHPKWIDELMARTGLGLDAGFMPVIRHLNHGINFCLLEFRDETGRNLWFKAVGQPNLHEYGATLYLARRFPAFLPKIVDTIPDWHGWLMEDAAGAPLAAAGGIAPSMRTFSALAEMQRGSMDEISNLVTLGARDWRSPKIAPLLEPFFAEAELAIEAQTSCRAPRILRVELRSLKREIEAALEDFHAAGPPDTLLHGDLGHGNVRCTAGGPVFLDWSEIGVGHPFLSAELLLEDLRCSKSTAAGEDSLLRRHYAAQWKKQISQFKRETLIALSPAICAFVYALSVWQANRGRPDHEEAWPTMRSLLRRTRKELERRRERVA